MQYYILSQTDDTSSPSGEALVHLGGTSIKPSNKNLSKVSWVRLQLLPLGETSGRVVPNVYYVHISFYGGKYLHVEV